MGKISAKVIPSKRACYISYDGQEIPKENYEVLCNGNVSWVHCMPMTHSVPPFALCCGITAAGEPLYIGMWCSPSRHTDVYCLFNLILHIKTLFKVGPITMAVWLWERYKSRMAVYSVQWLRSCYWFRNWSSNRTVTLLPYKCPYPNKPIQKHRQDFFANVNKSIKRWNWYARHNHIHVFQ